MCRHAPPASHRPVRARPDVSHAAAGVPPPRPVAASGAGAGERLRPHGRRLPVASAPVRRLRSRAERVAVQPSLRGAGRARHLRSADGVCRGAMFAAGKFDDPRALSVGDEVRSAVVAAVGAVGRAAGAGGAGGERTPPATLHVGRVGARVAVTGHLGRVTAERDGGGAPGDPRSILAPGRQPRLGAAVASPTVAGTRPRRCHPPAPFARTAPAREHAQ